MQSSDFQQSLDKGQRKHSGIAAAVTMAVLTGLAVAHSACAAPKDDSGKPKSIYEVKNTSVYDVIDSGRGINQEEDDDTEVRRLLRIVTSAGNELMTEPDALGQRNKVFLDGDSGEVDEDGRPISIREKAHREIVHKLAFENLKAQGYSWAEQKKKIEKMRDQPDRWELERRRVARYEAQHGRMTTKHFTHPGTTPEESEIMNDPKNAYRWIDGEWTLVKADGTRAFPKDHKTFSYDELHRHEEKPIATVSTRITKRPARSSDVTVMNMEKADPVTASAKYNRPVTKSIVSDIINGQVSYKDPNLTVDQIEKLFPDMAANGGSVEIRENLKADSLANLRAEEEKAKAEIAARAEALKKAQAAAQKKAEAAKKAAAEKKPQPKQKPSTRNGDKKKKTQTQKQDSQKN